MRRIEPVLRRALSGPCALPRGARILVAASGGADSTALLIALHRVAPSFGLEVRAAHLHHGLRGADADADARFVADLCAAFDIPLEARRLDVAARMRAAGLAGQQGYRAVRRAFLAAAARRAGCAAIATAHTADDQLETLLMRLGRGTGPAGLAGIPARRGRWIRPLLGATRAAIETDLRAANATWREDASNRDGAYTRNRLRHEAVPALVAALAAAGGAAPGDPARARAGLARRTAEALSELGEVSRWLDAHARRIVRRLGVIESAVVTLPTAPLRALPRALRLAVLRRAWAPIGREGLRRAHLDALDRALLAGAPRGPIALPGGAVATARRGRLRLAAAPAVAREARGSGAARGPAARRADARCGRASGWGTVTPRRAR